MPRLSSVCGYYKDLTFYFSFHGHTETLQIKLLEGSVQGGREDEKKGSTRRIHLLGGFLGWRLLLVQIILTYRAL